MKSLVGLLIASWVSMSALGGCTGGRGGVEREDMKAEQQDEYQVHLFVSNQNLALDTSAMEVSIDGRQVFHQELVTGTQHTWARETISAGAGKHSLTISEAKTRTRRSQEVNVSQDLWVVIRFHGPPPQLKVDVFDHPVGLM
jgi:hypothetical protein